MKGFIYKRAKDSWTIVVDLPRNSDGKRRQKSVAVYGTKKDAERELAKVLTQINTGDYVEPSRMTFADLAERWLADYAKPKVAAKTYERYQEIVRKSLIPALGRHPISKLQPLHIQAFYSEISEKKKGKSNQKLFSQTVLHYHRVLRQILQQAVKWQLLARNPADAVEPPRPTRAEMKVLNEQEVARLIQAASGSRFYVPILLALTTGLRRGEILGLKWSDIDLDAGTLSVRRSLEQTKGRIAVKEPKTAKSRRLIVLPPVVVEALQKHKEEQSVEKMAVAPAYCDAGFISAQPDGKPMPPSSISTYVVSANSDR